METSEFNFVRTESTAVEILKEWSRNSRSPINIIRMRCECGETYGYEMENGKSVARVGVCESCGDDSESAVNALNVQTYPTLPSYSIRDRETGSVIEGNLSHQEACATLRSFEIEDLRNGIYQKNFYEIVENTKQQGR